MFEYVGICLFCSLVRKDKFALLVVLRGFSCECSNSASSQC